jgi:rhodanese-related sulfurtransferase
MAMVDGGGIWLDVRLPDHYQQSHPRGHSLNAPFFSLRMMLPTLDREKNFVVVCEDGKVSEAAAYLLLRFRFNAYVLKGGIPSLPAEALTSESSAAQEPASAEKPSESKTAFRPIDQPGQRAEEPASPAAEPAAETDDRTGANHGPARRCEHDLRDLEARLSRLMGEKEKSDAELQQARHTIHKLEASLKALQREHERLMKDSAENRQGMEPQGATAAEDLSRELEALKARYSEALFEKESAAQEARNLETQVDDLKAMVEEFLEQGEFALTEQTEALRAELDMVREQAGAELTTLQSLFSEAEAENVRLRGELQSLKIQISVRDVATSVHTDESAAAKRSLALQSGWALAAGLLLTALVLGGLFGLEPGRKLARSWLGEAAPAQATEAPL